jgi:hypothetical protein
MFVVGAFDTVSETSQIQYCSVGQWDGVYFEKVLHLNYLDIVIVIVIISLYDY